MAAGRFSSSLQTLAVSRSARMLDALLPGVLTLAAVLGLGITLLPSAAKPLALRLMLLSGVCCCEPPKST